MWRGGRRLECLVVVERRGVAADAEGMGTTIGNVGAGPGGGFFDVVVNREISAPKGQLKY